MAGAVSPPVSVSSRADNCRASSLKALFSTGVSDGGLASPGGRNGKTFFDVSACISARVSFVVSTAVSKSVGCEVRRAIGSGNSVNGGDAMLVSMTNSAGKSCAYRS